MRLTVFASGSSGNCALVQGGGRRVLLDAGISAKRIKTALAGEGLSPDGLDGIFITHEHSDHIAGLAVLLKQFPVPVYAPGMVAEALRRSVPGASAYMRDIPLERPVDLDGLTVTAFSTPHDAPQSAGYRLEAEGQALALATDTGCVTDVMLEYLSGAETVLIEANHDEAMLRCGPYPAYLKRRILSDRGHLSNGECTWLASVLAHRGAERIVLGHLSRQNNAPALARQAVSRGLESTRAQLFVAPELGRLEVDGALCCI
ncbi:MAG: MBL fold metallo-hydrolase [Oscillospiraceae bacterium]|nr:MBL fold metallo-hydrolase [Oscillospiraceae bacterium]